MSSPDRPPRSTGARRGRVVGQALYFGVMVWFVVSGAVPILRESFWRRPAGVKTELDCGGALTALRARLDEAAIPEVLLTEGSEVAAVRAFRARLSDDQGRAWDLQVQTLVDGCPDRYARAAYTLAQLRADDESAIRLDARQGAVSRRAHAAALRALDHPSAP